MEKRLSAYDMDNKITYIGEEGEVSSKMQILRNVSMIQTGYLIDETGSDKNVTAKDFYESCPKEVKIVFLNLEKIVAKHIL